MTFRHLMVCMAGVFTNVLIALLALTPLHSTNCHFRDLPDPVALKAFRPARERRAFLGAAKVLFPPAESDVIRSWSPTIREALQTDSALAVYFAEHIRAETPSPYDRILLATRRDARLVIGVDHLLRGRELLIVGVDPERSLDADLALDCGDEQWRWSITYGASDGFHDFTTRRGCQ